MERDAGFIGRGWPFPITPGRNGRVPWLSGETKVKQSIWLILSTSPGERQMRPEFGCGIHDLVFQANTAALRGVVAQQVRDGLMQWEPRIDVLDVRVETDPLDPIGSRLLIYVDYRLRSNNAFYNLVYPFYVDEGPESLTRG
jgi:phage baseplate assembly protein W